MNDSYIKSVKNQEPYGPLTHRLIMKNGAIKFVEERGNTIYDENGKPLRSYGTCQDITERVLGDKTKAQLKEKEVLLKEIYHRVKNNLQLISSLLNIQASKIEDKEIRDIIETNQRRISAIASVHNQLCKSENLASVQASDFIASLIENYQISASTDSQDISFDLRVTESSISLDRSVAFRLILNEVVSNCVKHAFPSRSGNIIIVLTKDLDNWSLEISDNGVGVEDLDQFKQTSSFGMEIIRNLTDQLDGNLEIFSSKDEGTRFLFRFPI